MTTVFFTGDPIAPRTFTEEATRQEYFPEWVINGSILTGTAAFGRTYDQRQWAHAFGITAGPARVREEQGGEIWKLHEWYHGGRPPAAKDTYGILWFQPAMFYAALQAAGPDLTPETFRDGCSPGGRRGAGDHQRLGLLGATRASGPRSTTTASTTSP